MRGLVDVELLERGAAFFGERQGRAAAGESEEVIVARCPESGEESEAERGNEERGKQQA